MREPKRTPVKAILFGFGIGLALCVIAFACFGCASGPVTTSTGAIVPAAIVQTEDNFADALHMLRATQAQAVAVFESTKGTMDPVLRKAEFKILNDTADAIDSSQALLIAAKRAGAGATTAEILRPLLTAGPTFLRLAVSIGVMKQADADLISRILAAIPPIVPGATHLFLPMHRLVGGVA